MDTIRIRTLLCIILGGSVSSQQCVWYTYNTSSSQLLIECNAKEIPIDFIGSGSYMNHSSLVDLQIHAGLNSIASNTFTGAGNLKRLNLSQNEIETVEGEAFSGLHQLEQLDLSGNQLTELHEATFFDLPQLRTLNMQNNHIRNFDFKCLSKNPRLKELNLKENPDLMDMPPDNGRMRKKRKSALRTQQSNSIRTGGSVMPKQPSYIIPRPPVVWMPPLQPIQNNMRPMQPPKPRWPIFKPLPPLQPRPTNAQHPPNTNLFDLSKAQKIPMPSQTDDDDCESKRAYQRWVLSRGLAESSDDIVKNYLDSSSALLDPITVHELGESGLSDGWIITIVLVLTLGVPSLIIGLLVYFC